MDKKKNGNGKHDVTISAGDKTMTVAPTVFVASPGDTVTFRCAGQFQVVFEDSPFDGTAMFNRENPTGKIAGNALGVYHYAVAVTGGREGGIVMTTGCPEIIIN